MSEEYMLAVLFNQEKTKEEKYEVEIYRCEEKELKKDYTLSGIFYSYLHARAYCARLENKSEVQFILEDFTKIQV